jgi:hypothetical protein
MAMKMARCILPTSILSDESGLSKKLFLRIYMNDPQVKEMQQIR